MNTRKHHTQFIRTHKVPNQNNEVTDLLAALAAGETFRLTERATLDLHDLLQNNVDGIEDVLEGQNIEAGFELDAVCGSIRTIEDIMTDIAELASEPTAEELIADFYRTPKFNPVVATFGKVRRTR